MRSIIQFRISKDGEHYTASGVDFPVVTQADSLDELTGNIKEAAALHLEGEDLSEMFGYITTLRSMTEGRASFTMEFDSYQIVPTNVADEIIAKRT